VKRTTTLVSSLAVAAGLLLTSFAAFGAGAVDTSGPSKLIESASNLMLADLDANRDKYRRDKSGLYKVVDEVLLPNFDVNYAAQQVLGQNWRTATPDQRQRFVKAFYRSLLTTYGDALIDFTADKLKILPYTGDPAANRATVRTQIRTGGGDMVAVNYSLRRADAGWKAWDVVIEGISYVQSFKQDFGAEVAQKGLDALIQRLEAGALPASAPKPGSTP
jgi:phospholipid transport system substrate-binding protein